MSGEEGWRDHCVGKSGRTNENPIFNQLSTLFKDLRVTRRRTEQLGIAVHHLGALGLDHLHHLETRDTSPVASDHRDSDTLTSHSYCMYIPRLDSNHRCNDTLASATRTTSCLPRG